jgi:hypothetical protein
MSGTHAIRKRDGGSFIVTYHGGDCYEDSLGTAEWSNVNAEVFYPLLVSSATQGCLEFMLRLCDPRAVVEYDDGEPPGPVWRVWSRSVAIATVPCREGLYEDDLEARGQAIALALLSSWKRIDNVKW